MWRDERWILAGLAGWTTTFLVGLVVIGVLTGLSGQAVLLSPVWAAAVAIFSLPVCAVIDAACRTSRRRWLPALAYAMVFALPGLALPLLLVWWTVPVVAGRVVMTLLSPHPRRPAEPRCPQWHLPPRGEWPLLPRVMAPPAHSTLRRPPASRIGSR